MAKLTQHQVSLLTSRIANAKCQVCGSPKWTINDELVSVQLTAYQPGAITMGSNNKPAVEMECNNCGQIILLDAKRLGLA